MESFKSNTGASEKNETQEILVDGNETEKNETLKPFKEIPADFDNDNAEKLSLLREKITTNDSGISRWQEIKNNLREVEGAADMLNNIEYESSKNYSSIQEADDKSKESIKLETMGVMIGGLSLTVIGTLASPVLIPAGIAIGVGAFPYLAIRHIVRARNTRNEKKRTGEERQEAIKSVQEKSPEGYRIWMDGQRRLNKY